MPYAGADDPDLPSNVKKMPLKKRQAWIATFNHVYDTQGEGSAFRIANAGAKALKALADILSDAAFWAELKADWIEALSPMARQIFDAGVEAARNVKPLTKKRHRRGKKDFLDPDPQVLDNVAGQVFGSYMDDWWAQLEEATRNGLRDALERAAANGTGTPGVIEDITPLFGEQRARVIGVTETTRLFGRGAVATYRASAIEQWEWQTSSDDLVCEECDMLDGQLFGVDEDFDPAHPSCRCFAAPVAAAGESERRTA